MRIKLFHKFAAINIGLICALTLAFIALSHGYSKGMLSRAFNGIDDDVMQHLAERLEDHYRQHATWEGFLNERAQWNQLADSTFVTVFGDLLRKAARNQGHDLPGPDASSVKSAIEGAQSMPFGSFRQRVSLLDSERRVLIPAEVPSDHVGYQAIKVNGDVVGWLQVGRINLDIVPLTLYFFEQQLSVILWAAIFGACVAAFLGYLLARHVTAPIQQLADGARQLAARNFDTRIEVKTRDELRDLADNFNTISSELSRFQTQQKAWLTNVSHELKSPLTLLVGEIFAICDNLSRCDEKTAELVQAEALHIKRIADDLQAICNVDEFGLEVRLEQVDVVACVSHQLDRYEPQYAAKGLRLTRRLPASPLMAMADADRLAQVVRNLLENGLRYCDVPGELRLTLESSGDLFVIEVQDSGPGVPEGSLSKLFNRLYRQNHPGNRASRGAGVGLEICKHLVLAHGGDIEASIGELGGLCIRVTLPTTQGRSA